MTPIKALHIALSRAAERGYQLPLTVTEVRESEEGLSTLCEQLSDESVLALLRAKDGAQGVVSVDHGLLAGLIEIQTAGRITPAAPTPRAPTRTDVSMCEGFVNHVFSLLEQLLDADHRGAWFYGYRMGPRVETTRKLGLLLDDGPMIVFRLTLDLGQGAKTGAMLLALPADIRAVAADGTLAPDAEDWREGLRSTVLGSEVNLDAVLQRLTLPLSDVQRLEVGQMLNLSERALSEVRLEASDGSSVAVGRLGKFQGARALRLNGEEVGQTFASRRPLDATVSAAAGPSANTPQQVAVSAGDSPVPDGIAHRDTTAAE